MPSPNRQPQLPLELKGLIVKCLAADEDQHALLKLRQTDADFAHLTKPYVFRHVDFRNKHLSLVSSFGAHVAPRYSPYINSLSHRPIDEDFINEVELMGDRLRLLSYWDETYARAMRRLTEVETVDLTIPKLEFHSLYGNSMDVIKGWKMIKHMTVRSAGWGRGQWDSDTDAFNARTVASMLTDFPSIRTFRALGISGADISPDGPSLQALLKMPPLGLTALHLAGGWLAQFTVHFARLAPPLTHLVLSEDAVMEWLELEELLLAVQTTLVSLSVRQHGALADDRATPTVCPDLHLNKLERLVLSFDGELLLILDKFTLCPALRRLELGTDDAEFTRHLLRMLRTDNEMTIKWPLLTELGYFASRVDSEDWNRLHEICEQRGVEFRPGFTKENDFP